MKKYFVLLSIIVAAVCASAKGVYTRQCADSALVQKAAQWVQQGQWRHGFQSASPHASVNTVDFYEQYSRNPRQWEAMFKWLAETDLLAIEAGKHPIPGTSLVASVEDSENGELARRRSESHREHVDFQYVVKGVERFGIIDHSTSFPSTDYRPDVIHYAYDPVKAVFHDSTPGEFFLFFPEDWHIAKVKTDLPDQKIRVVVIKPDYVH